MFVEYHLWGVTSKSTQWVLAQLGNVEDPGGCQEPVEEVFWK